MIELIFAFQNKLTSLEPSDVRSLMNIVNPQMTFRAGLSRGQCLSVFHYAEVTSDRTSLSPFTKETRGAAS